MRVIVIAPREKRGRFRFVCDPLLDQGHQVDVRFSRPVGRYILSLFELLFVSKSQYDGIITIGLGAKNTLMLLMGRLRGWPVIARLGGDPIRDGNSVSERLWLSKHYVAWLKRRFNLAGDRFLLARIDGAIVVNAALKDRIKPHTKAFAPIFVVTQFNGGAVEPRSYDIQGPVVLLTVANLRYKEKADGVIWLVCQLAAFVRENEVSLQFRIAGGGMEFPRVRRYIGEMNVPKDLSLQLFGFVDDVAELYSQADIFLYRSFLDGTPNVILESKRFSLPLLANACEAFSTIVNDGETGYLYDGEAVFQQRLKQLCTDESLRKKLGRNAAKGHAQWFSKQAVAVELERALSMMVANQ